MNFPRYPSIDALRGIALAAMIVYHAAWDLDHFGYAQWALYTDWAWLAFRDAILVAFLGLSGVSLILATRGGVDWPRFVQRRALIALGAAAITAFSLAAFPGNAIWFGVLHFVAVASFIVLPARRWPWPALTALALAIFAATPLLRDPLFNQPWLHWIGLVTREPQTGDYVPLLPWLAAVYAGMALGRLFVQAAEDDRFFRLARRWQPRGPVGRGLVWSGERSLVIYLLHQPVLVGLIVLVSAVAPPAAPPAFVEAFTDECRLSCGREGATKEACAAYCACATEVVEREFGWVRLRAEDLTADEIARIRDEAEACMKSAP